MNENENDALKLAPTRDADRSGSRRRRGNGRQPRPSDAYCQLRYSSCGSETSTARELFLQAGWTHPSHRADDATCHRRRRLDQLGPEDVPGGRREADVTRLLDALRWW